MSTATHRNRYLVPPGAGTVPAAGNFQRVALFERGIFEEVVMGPADRLPSRFPDGTRFVVEGRGGHIVSRYLEFPDGRHVELPVYP